MATIYRHLLIHTLRGLAETAGHGDGSTLILIPSNSDDPIIIAVDGIEMVDDRGQPFGPIRAKEFYVRACDLRLADRNRKQTAKTRQKEASK
jgi:hypothetical protein